MRDEGIEIKRLTREGRNVEVCPKEMGVYRVGPTVGLQIFWTTKTVGEPIGAETQG